MRVIISLLCFCLIGGAQAGSQAPSKSVFAPEEIISFAKEVERYAAEHQAYAFVIGRVGRPEKELPKGIHFTHTAVAVYSQITLDDGTTEFGYAIHNLYQRADDPGRSDIIVDYPVDFFWGAQTLKAGIVIPSPAVQQQLINLISEQKHLRLHNPRYSVVANPFNSQRQNCTEFTLDILQAAIYHTADTQRIKANNAAYFSPQKVSINPIKLAVGSMVSDGITTSDHKGRVQTATFTTIARFLAQFNLAEHSVVLYADGHTQAI
ncbi:DUF2145 domain-containing protein [Alteromonas lipolytica]|uniref:DUF2145 domain-containing protein n=1 Tax=Alteromonas lipolytica TaxID=1856405 RepID=A0A1E8FCX4_9ALTE|nr:DUF2145 domain-containing protein [Alteromonas lipolytica]OFI33787.1 hypothetical protein BFC17_19645 [Alteromonas lipolytica]GGF68368.1 hypothetical protein GCM10011338_20740 [Alteromonas lipolytica]